MDVAVEQARDFLASGADILDVGGESTRPGSAPVNADEEMERVIPVIHALNKNFPEAIISIDTYKAQVAEEAIKAGAHIVNDVWGLRADDGLAFVAAKYKTSCDSDAQPQQPCQCGSPREVWECVYRCGI